MHIHAVPYVQHLSDDVCQTITVELSTRNAMEIAKAAFAFHFSDRESLNFQQYYAETIENQANFLNVDNFFVKFKKMYALQGIDNGYLATLEAAKAQILEAIVSDQLTGIYLNYFARASIQHGAGRKTKNLASFFAKLVHTFKPADYCALDNPIKNHFGLAKEGFFISFLVISSAYRQWTRDNNQVIADIREQLLMHPIGKKYSCRMTDLKLLDLIYWLRANKPHVLP